MNWTKLRKLHNNDPPLMRSFRSLTRESDSFRLIQTAMQTMQQRVWLWPVLAIIILTITGGVIQTLLKSTLEQNVRSQLQTLLDLEASMLRQWIVSQTTSTESVADDLRLQQEMLRLLHHRPTQNRQNSSERLASVAVADNFRGYFLVDASYRIAASSDPQLCGQQLSSTHKSAVSRSLNGLTVIAPPTTHRLVDETEQVPLSPIASIMFVCTPVRDADQQVVGALGLLLDPNHRFTQLVEQGYSGQTGSTYAFNKDGVILSHSRFDEELVLLGMLPEQQQASSFLYLQVRDPGQNTLVDGRPRRRLSELPLTRMAQSAIDGESGVTTQPYRDFRGVPVIGAWTWIPEMDIGLATEIEYAEAFAAVSVVDNAFRIIVAVLAAVALMLMVRSFLVERRRKARELAGLESTELGQYVLESKLGEGAMGVVYRASHSMMQRVTAVKLLNLEKTDASSIQRFEHEVRIACQLTHPNTISIYDYGRTAEGTFYYAMEYLDGIDLQQLVEKYGPQPEGRVIQILKQVCGALYEAHKRGLVHRDIKPSNIMINLRGEEADFVKVLDFGLVKTINAEQDSATSLPDSINGTALYMSPEAIQAPSSVDARSDIYAVGAVGYFLLTGQPVFSGVSLAALLQKHISAMPLPPSVCLGKPVSEELESALLACLSKTPAGRPESTRILGDLLNNVPTAQSWTRDEAERWWSRVQRGLSPRIPRIGRSVTCKFEQTMVNMEEELRWSDTTDQAVGENTGIGIPDPRELIDSWNLRTE